MVPLFWFRPDKRGQLFPQPTQCLMEEGDVCITMHAIPHAATRNDGTEPRLNMIWRIQSKARRTLHRVHHGRSLNRVGVHSGMPCHAAALSCLAHCLVLPVANVLSTLSPALSPGGIRLIDAVRRHCRFAIVASEGAR